MEFVTELHMHSRFSRACSKDLTLKTLEKWAKVKGVSLLGTSDFTHPEWIKELKGELKEDEQGIYRSATGFPFMLTSEVSLMYSQGDKGRRVHNLIFAPSFEVVDQITEYLKSKGRIDYDGRPIFKIPCPEFTERLKEISKDIAKRKPAVAEINIPLKTAESPVSSAMRRNASFKRRSVGVVLMPFLFVREHLIRFVDFFELRLVAGFFVGVMLVRHLAIRLFYLFFRSVFIHA